MYSINTGDPQLYGLAFDGNQFFVVDTGDSPDQLEKIDIGEGGGATMTLMNNGVSCPADALNDLYINDCCLIASKSTNIYHFYEDGSLAKSLAIGGKGVFVIGEFLYVCS